PHSHPDQSARTHYRRIPTPGLRRAELCQDRACPDLDGRGGPAGTNARSWPGRSPSLPCHVGYSSSQEPRCPQASLHDPGGTLRCALRGRVFQQNHRHRLQRPLHLRHTYVTPCAG
ncbi:hypothetical protein chiPu_0028181, partial [Chiloscyllium punctatum]|nr:hypothetical protein [Chiloscyllium punctatum]